MILDDVRLDSLAPPPWARGVDWAHVEELAYSIEQSGLICRIRVRPSPFVNSGFEIIAGRHRVEAFERLGRESIPAEIVEIDDATAELMTIDENLMRRNLSPAEEAIAVARRKVLYEERHPETRHGGNGSGPSGQFAHTAAQSFSAQTSAATGVDPSTIRRASRRGEVLADVLPDVAGTSLDRGVELDALARRPAEERRALVDRARAGEIVSARVKPATRAFDPRATSDRILREASIAQVQLVIGHLSDGIADLAA